MRKKLTGNRTYCVRTDGNDNNDGLSNTAAGAFASVNGAVTNLLNNVDTQGYNVTIQIADGTYTGSVVVMHTNVVGGGNVYITGNTSTPSNVVLVSPTGSSCFHLYNYTTPTNLSGFKTIGYGPSLYSCGAMIVDGNSTLTFGMVDFGSWGSGSHIKPNIGSWIAASANYTVSGPAGCHIDAQFNAVAEIRNVTVTVNNTPRFIDSFALGYHMTRVEFTGTTITGSATGRRWRNGNLSVHRTGLGNSSATYFPGSINGSLGAGSLYI